MFTQAGGEVVYSSASPPKLCPSSCNMISALEAWVEATGMAPPEPPYTGSFTSTIMIARCEGLRLAVATVRTLEVLMHTSLAMPEQLKVESNAVFFETGGADSG